MNKLPEIILIIFIIILLISYKISPYKRIFGRKNWHRDKKIIDIKYLNGGETRHIFDIYSFSHISYGILFYFLLKLLGFNINSIFIIIFTFAIIWEIFENNELLIKKYGKVFKKYDGDTFVNIIGDLICAIIGIYLAHNIPIVSIIYSIIVEIYLYKYKASLFYLSFVSLYKIIKY